jgi:hypothetical protein
VTYDAWSSVSHATGAACPRPVSGTTPQVAGGQRTHATWCRSVVSASTMGGPVVGGRLTASKLLQPWQTGREGYPRYLPNDLPA